MLTVTEKASEMIKDAMKNEKNSVSIRITKQSGCCGPSLGMALDKPNESDVTFTDRGIQYHIDKDLLEEMKPVTIDFRGADFRLTSGLPREGSGGGCCG